MIQIQIFKTVFIAVLYIISTLILLLYFYLNRHKREIMDEPRAYYWIAFALWAVFTLIFGGVFWW